jgi:hypothetical protein
VAAGSLWAFLLQVRAFVFTGILTPEEAQVLLEEGTYIRDRLLGWDWSR